jgi:RHS repeat-associated protein
MFLYTGRLIGTTTQYSYLPGFNFQNAYTYDAASNRTSLTAPDSSISTYGYDTLNRLNGLANSWAGSFGFGYDALSRRTSLMRPNGVNTNYIYDSVSHLLSVLHQAGTTTLDGASYNYDPAGNRTSKGNYLNGVTSNYGYDPLYELTQVTQGGSTTESYSYDAVGNRLSSSGVPTYNYNSSNELTSDSSGSYTYDANGNTLSDPSGKQYTWDFENRLTQAVVPGTNGGTTTFKYDPFGRRIQKSGPLGTTNYLYDGPNALQEVDNSGVVLARYIDSSEVDDQLSELRSSTVSYYEQDEIGSVSSVTNSANAIVGTYAYDAFGNLTASTGTLTNPFRFTGREFDAETGIYFYRARYYDPAVGRFLGEDPLGFPGSGSNFYAYVKNDPATLSDPFGLCPKQKKCKKCASKVLAAVSSKIGVPVTLVGPTSFPAGTTGTLDPDDPGMRNGACNFDFFVPGYTPPPDLGHCGRYSPNFAGIGSSLHIVYPKGPCNLLGDPTTYAVDETGFYFTGHMDSGYGYSPLGFLVHEVGDVLLRLRHGC